MNKYIQLLTYHGMHPKDVNIIKMEHNTIFLEFENKKYKLEGDKKTLIDEIVSDEKVVETFVQEEILEEETEEIETVEEIVEEEIVEEETEVEEDETEIIEVEANDLTELVGVGPKIEEMLNFKGIYTFEQLAEINPKELYDVLTETFAGNPAILKTELWVDQAKLKIS